MAPSCSQSELRLDRAQASKQSQSKPCQPYAGLGELCGSQLQHHHDICDTANHQLALGGLRADSRACLRSRKGREGALRMLPIPSKARNEGSRDGSKVISFCMCKMTVIIWNGFPKQVNEGSNQEGCIKLGKSRDV